MEYKTDNRGHKKLLALVLVLVAISLLSRYYIDWLWFKSLNLESVFTTTLVNKIGLYALVFVVSFLFILLNLWLTKKNIEPESERPAETEEGREIIYLHPESSSWSDMLQGKVGKWAFIITSLVAAYIVSSSWGDNWIVVQQFIHRAAFNLSDPVFNKDVGFYFFNLSLLELIYRTSMLILILTAVVVGMVYLVNATRELFLLEWKTFTFSKSHLAVLLAAIFALKAWGYRLDAYNILFSHSGIVYGATYTDIHARLLAYKILMALALLVAVLIIVNIFIKKVKWILYSIVAWIVLAIIMGGIYPSLIQKIVVQPNEFVKEKPYIESAIKFTRLAYNLHQVDNKEFNIDYKLTMQDINNNKATIDNIRLWDWQPLRDTYKSLQELRLYYIFNDVDIDRYTIDGKYRQVMLSAREMEDMNKNTALPAQARTWVNYRLMYTHGYGVTMSPVNAIAQEGFPQFYIKDIPPAFSTDIKIKRPEIYFGESTDSYVIVNGKQQEFDYPMGTQNVYTTYQGKNGIKINSISRRLLLSWVLKDYKLILSSDLSNDSQVLMNRNITERVKKIAPYLEYDHDPYIVINDDGRLYWMQDAYTYADKYPYSQPYDDFGNNYIRNSVKIVTDAYTGEVSFYVADMSDPLIKAYQGIFPKLYKPLEQMPAGLKAHIRYPENMFNIQASIYRIYHMSDPWVFYNKEDSWVVPTEMVENKETTIEPYYIIMRLPGEEKAEYIFMLPYVPNGRPNMIAWMCARMDGDNYGRILVYRFPKQETVYGPMQIESRINQDTEISKQLTLWGQKGSRTRRGNLLVIPINNSILYIEPLYLQAETSSMPELKRVIAAYGNKVVMGESLEQALGLIFGSTTGTPAVGPENEGTAAGTTVQELARLARQYYDKAYELLRQGDWNGYGDNINKLNEVIKKLEETANK